MRAVRLARVLGAGLGFPGTVSPPLRFHPQLPIGRITTGGPILKARIAYKSPSLTSRERISTFELRMKRQFMWNCQRRMWITERDCAASCWSTCMAFAERLTDGTMSMQILLKKWDSREDNCQLAYFGIRRRTSSPVCRGTIPQRWDPKLP